MQEVSTVVVNIICEPFVQVQILASGGKGGDIQREYERLHLQKRLQDLEETVRDNSSGRCHATNLQVLRNIEDPGDIQRTLLVKVSERISKIRGLDLPNPHEHELMIGVTT